MSTVLVLLERCLITVDLYQYARRRLITLVIRGVYKGAGLLRSDLIDRLRNEIVERSLFAAATPRT